MSEKNYVTEFGFKSLQDELLNLKKVERPEVVEVVAWAASNGDRSENGDYLYGKRKLREIDRRIRYLSKQIDNAEIVKLRGKDCKQIFFGATVSVMYESGEEKTFKIVGVDELDIEAGKISHKSPLAKALIKKEEGDVIDFQSPKGVQEIEIVGVSYN